jgi:hypothetical protein
MPRRRRRKPRIEFSVGAEHRVFTDALDGQVQVRGSAERLLGSLGAARAS